MWKRNFWSSLGLMFILALSALIQFTVVMRTTSILSVGSDAADYFSYAYNLKYKHVYSNYRTWAVEAPSGGLVADALRPPGYPLFLLAIPGVSIDTSYTHRVYLAQAGLGVGSVLLVFLIADRFLRPGLSHLVALLTAITPHLATMSTYLMSESLFLFLLLASTYTTILAARSKAWQPAFVAGLLWGGCNLVRPTMILFAPLLLTATLIVPAFKSQRKSALILTFAFVLIQAPWFVRNQVTPLDQSQRSLMVDTLHHGSYPDFMYQGRPETLGWPFRFDPNSEWAERSLPNVLSDIVAKVRSAPYAYLKWYLVGKPGALLSWGYVQGWDIYMYTPTHSPYVEDERFVVLRKIMLILHWPLMMLGVLGACITFWQPRWLYLEGDRLVAGKVVSAIVLYAIVFHMVAAPFPRYGVPFRPLIYMLAVLCMATPFVRSSRHTTISSESRLATPT